jgi:hypothetical protein
MVKQLSQTEILRYTYESESEREKHVERMELKGYECTGQKKISFNSLFDSNKEYHWYGEFVKHS